MNPKVSIIIPVYNTADYLNSLYDSLAGQTYDNFEVIFVDDESSDGSVEKLVSFSNFDPRFFVISRKNGGEGAARNTGLRFATGKYVMFFDSDDFVEPNMLSLMVGEAERNDANEVICAIDAYHEEGNRFEENAWAVAPEIPSNQVFNPRDIEQCFRYIVGYAANKLYRLDFIRKHKLSFQEIRTHGDLSFSYAALACAERVVYVDTALYHHRIRKGSLSATTQDSHWVCLFEALVYLRSELKRLGLWERYEREFVNYSVQMSQWKFGKVQGSARVELDEQLRTKWFEELGISNRPKEYFFREEYYDFIQGTLSTPYAERADAILESLLIEEFEQEKILAKLEEQIASIRESQVYMAGYRLLNPLVKTKRVLFRKK